MAKNLTPDLTDELWQAIEPHLPPRRAYNPKGGRPWCPDKATLRGIPYVLREGGKWQSVPSWWSRLALPALHARTTENRPLRLVEQTVPKGDTDLKALSRYGLLRADTGRMMLRFVSGHPVSQMTEDHLAWARAIEGGREKGVALGVGQRGVAHQQAGARLDQGPQPEGPCEGRCSDRGVLPAREGATAQPD